MFPLVGTCVLKDRRAREKKIETARREVKSAMMGQRKVDPEVRKVADEHILKDETEEGQSTQECEVGNSVQAVYLVTVVMVPAIGFRELGSVRRPGYSQPYRVL